MPNLNGKVPDKTIPYTLHNYLQVLPILLTTSVPHKGDFVEISHSAIVLS